MKKGSRLLSFLCVITLVMSLIVIETAAEDSDEMTLNYNGVTYTYTKYGELCNIEGDIQGNLDLVALEKAAGISFTSIGQRAFTYQRHMTFLNLSATIRSIDFWAFDGCSSLLCVTYEEGSQLSSIGFCAFQGLDVFGTFGPKGQTVTGTCQFPKGVQSIAELAFANDDGVKSVLLPDDLLMIGDDAFSSTVTIYASAGSVGEKYAKDNNIKFVEQKEESTTAATTTESKEDTTTAATTTESKEDTTAAATTTESKEDTTAAATTTESKKDTTAAAATTQQPGGSDMQGNATTEQKQQVFSSEDKATENVSTAGTTQQQMNQTAADKKKKQLKKGDAVRVGSYCYKITGKNTVCFTACKNKKVKSLKIPASIKIKKKKYQVTRVGKKACYGLKKLSAVMVGDQVRQIDAQAFAGCKKLKEITIGKKIRSLGKSCFENDRKLKSVMINGKGLKKVGKHCMKGTGHKKYYVPESKVSGYQKLFHDAK